MNNSLQAPVLLVDDNPVKLFALESMLTDLALHLITAPSARDALQVLLNQEVAVILLDVNMPEMDGFELAELIRSHPRCAQTPIIFLSAVNTTEAYAFKGYSLGAVDYLADLNPVVIRAKVAVFVELFQKTRALRLLNAELEQRVQERTAALTQLNAVLQDEIAERRKTELALKQAEERQRFLAETSTLLASSLDYETTFRQVARLAVPRLADWCTVSRLDDQGRVETVAVAHVDSAKEAWAWELRRRYHPPSDVPYGELHVLRTGQPELYPDIPEAVLVEAARGDPALLHVLQAVGLSSAMAVPVIAQDQVLAVITFVATESGRHYSAADLAVAEEVARRAAMALENARLYREALEARDLLARQAEELSRSNAELQQFAYVASHDLQEPLRMVTTYVQLLAKRYEGALDARAKEFIGYAVEGAHRMKALIDDLLTYSRVGARTKRFAPVACEQVMTTTLQTLHLAITESQACIVHEPLPVIYGDEFQVGLLFQNLLSNAVKFCDSQPPQVHIAVRQDERQWRFAVQDNGIGVDPAHAEQIFALFHRLHTRNAYPGNGMGLAICKKIVEQHGGRIWVESAVGAGATFFFTLPAYEPETHAK